MGKELFRIHDVDFTGHIQMPSYTINSQPIYEEWQDGNGIYHRDIVRRRISGSFTMWFNDLSEYYEFLDYVNDSEETGGYCNISLYVNNLHEVADLEAFISLEPANTEPTMSQQHEGFTVNIEER